MKQSDLQFKENTKSNIWCTFCGYEFFWERRADSVSVYRVGGRDCLQDLNLPSQSDWDKYTAAMARKAIVEFCQGL